jgi:broad specificity phosphatase PhoE
LTFQIYFLIVSSRDLPAPELLAFELLLLRTTLINRIRKGSFKLTKQSIFILLIILAVISLATSVEAQPTIYLVRHAEKIPNWHGEELDDFHPLSEAGIARAQKLAGQFERGSLSAIFSSRTTRTLHTALPLAVKLGLPVQLSTACYDTTAIDSFYAELKKNFRANEAVLLVAHSNIIPYLLLRAGLPASCRREMGITLSPDDSGWLVIEGFDNLWRIEKLGATKNGCGDFFRRKY